MFITLSFLRDFLSWIFLSIQLFRKHDKELLFICGRAEDFGDTKTFTRRIKSLINSNTHVVVVPGPECTVPEFNKLIAIVKEKGATLLTNRVSHEEYNYDYETIDTLINRYPRPVMDIKNFSEVNSYINGSNTFSNYESIKDFEMSVLENIKCEENDELQNLIDKMKKSITKNNDTIDQVMKAYSQDIIEYREEFAQALKISRAKLAPTVKEYKGLSLHKALKRDPITKYEHLNFLEIVVDKRVSTSLSIRPLIDKVKQYKKVTVLHGFGTDELVSDWIPISFLCQCNISKLILISGTGDEDIVDSRDLLLQNCLDYEKFNAKIIPNTIVSSTCSLKQDYLHQLTATL